MCLAARSLPQRRAWIALLVLALAFAQVLGLVHRIVHAPLVLADAAARRISPDGPSGSNAPARATPSSPSSSWAPALFAHAGGDHVCHLYDQLSHADLLQAGVPSIAAVPYESACVPVPSAWQLALQAAGFLARAPPVAS